MATRKAKGAKGGGTIRQRPDGRWEARYTLGIDPGTGKQIQKSVYARFLRRFAEIPTSWCTSSPFSRGCGKEKCLV